MHFGDGVGDPAATLVLWLYLFHRQVGETNHLFVSVLYFHFGIVEASAIYAGRGTRLEPGGFKAMFHKLLGNTCRPALSDPSAAKLLLSYMNYAI